MYDNTARPEDLAELTETNSTLHFPPGRYGRRRERRPTPRWVPIALGAAVVAAGVVVAVLLTQQYGAGRPYDAELIRFYDIADDQVVVEFTVQVPEGETAVCAVRALDRDYAEVGREELRVDPPAGEARPLVVHQLSTASRPVSGQVQRCWRAGP